MPVDPEMSSPDCVRLSLASALALQIRSGRFYRDVHNGCINLLLTYPQVCQASCDYCGLARERVVEPSRDREGAVVAADGPMRLNQREQPLPYGRGSDSANTPKARHRSFIRVEWPIVPTDDVLARLHCRRDKVRRVCLSMVVHPRAYLDTITIARRLVAEAGGTPVSVLIAPSVVDEDRLRELRAAGVDRIGIGLDAASERVFGRRRHGLHWLTYWNTVAEARKVYGPDRVNCHIVVGLGETDAELIDICFRLRAMQVSPYLFSFYPEAGTLMQRARRPSLTRWRRLQLVAFHIEQDMIDPRQVLFDDKGRVVGLEVQRTELQAILATGQPFRTCGCPGADNELACTRPFGSYRPGEPFRDYPFAPEAGDLRRIERELRLGQLGVG